MVVRVLLTAKCLLLLLLAEGVSHGICARSCCAHCLKDEGCLQASLRGDQCWLTHADPTKPMGKRVTSKGLTLIVPKR